MKSLSLVLFIAFLALASSKSFLRGKKSEACSKTGGFGATSFIKVYLVADTGKFLARCNGCGSAAYSDSASIHGVVGNSWAQWKLYPGCDGKVALQADSGKYLARCNNCWYGGSYPDAAFVHEAGNGNSYDQWTLINNGDGTYGLKADTGRYLARCNGCVSGGSTSDFAFVHATDPSAAYAKWKIQLV